MQELWGPLMFRGKETNYSVSTKGRVKNKKHIIKPVRSAWGYDRYNIHTPEGVFSVGIEKEI